MIRKNSKKNKQGFTMVELLAVITILGIVSALAIVGISKLLENAKKEYYKATEKEVKVAAKSYIQNNRKYLPKSIGSKTTITLKTLQDNNYIKGVKDYSKQSCNTEKTYVQIFKYGQNKYTYTTYLECPNYNSRKVVKEEYTPAIDIKFIKTQQDSEEQMNDIKVAKAEITIKGSNDANLKLLSYNYIVYKDGSEVISSGSIEANYKEKITIKLDLNKYTPGTIKIKVGATNINGFSQTETKSANYADTQPPTCIIKDEDKQENPKPWINQTRKVTIGCDDGNGSGCTRSEYTKTFNNSTNIGTITIKDEAGNKTNCKVSVNVDKTKPTITIKAYQRTASGGKTGSAVATVKVNNKTSTATMDTYSNTTNKWLNKTNYPYGVYYEVTYSDNLALATKQWNYNALNLTPTDAQVNTIASGKGAVSISGTSGSQDVSLSGEGYRKAYYEVKDQAGNTSRINITAPIDRTAPVSPSINMYKWTNNSTRPTSPTGLTIYENNTWSNKSVYTTASNSTDALSGLNSYQYTTTGKTANATNETGQTRSVEAEGTSTIKYRACDKAGNCSAYTTEKTIKLDKTAPTCGSNNGSTTWTNASRTVTVNCSDSASGCTQSTFSQTYSSDTKTSSITIKDNIGNTTICPVNVYVDKTKPTIKITAYKRTSSGGKTGGSIASKMVNNTTSLGTISQYSNTTNGWLNNDNYPYGVYYEITYSDNFALSKRQWAYNLAGSKSASNATEGNGEITISGTTGSHNVSLSAEGYRNAYLKVVDEAGNISKIDIIAPIDRTPPYTLSVDLQSTIEHAPANSAFTIQMENNKKFYCSFSNVSGRTCNTCKKYYSSDKTSDPYGYWKEITNTNDEISYNMETYYDGLFTIYLSHNDAISGIDNLKMRYCHNAGCYWDNGNQWAIYPANEYRNKLASEKRNVKYIEYQNTDKAGNDGMLTVLRGFESNTGNTINHPISEYKSTMCK